jgi:NAD(P)-dependent dehydrogenase (short-subunit alcohol dehydrogenase family)
MTITLITGANKGIGYETARKLGGTILVGARDKDRGEAAASALRAEGHDARAVRLDVTDAAVVAEAVEWADREFGRLDTLINNAGMAGDDKAPSELSADVLRRTYETNVFGVATVTNAFIPLLRRSDDPRVVNVTSELGSLGYMSDPETDFYAYNTLAYNSSKSALNAITLVYAKELTGFRVNAVSPGYCSTDLNGHSGYRTPEQGAESVARVALLPPGGPTATFFAMDGSIAPW